MTARRACQCVMLVLTLCSIAQGQQPVDLFNDLPKLGDGWIRVGSWNLRHINLEDGATTFLPGNTRDEDFAILTATFAKAIDDLGLDIAAIIEDQPRSNEPNRLNQIRDRLNNMINGPWRSDETQIDYGGGGGDSQFGNLQMGILWNSNRVTINPGDDTLLSDLRQPRNDDGSLADMNLRAPWLVPVRAGTLNFDLMVLHLKSGGVAPQAAEVQALHDFIVARQSIASPHHLIICGDWNIRPDTSSGRSRLRSMRADVQSGSLMRILTVDDIHPTLDEWETLGEVHFGDPGSDLLPHSHFNLTSLDTLLDHIAISRTLSEIYDNPIQVKLLSGTMDLEPGIQIANPLIPEADYLHLTDHLPVILTLRVSQFGIAEMTVEAALSIVGAMPNPSGADEEFEEVHVRNNTTSPVSLAGWKIGDSTGDHFWILTAQDGTVAPGATVIVVRHNRPMYLNNAGGDTIVLIDPSNHEIDRESYGVATSGQFFQFP